MASKCQLGTSGTTEDQHREKGFSTLRGEGRGRLLSVALIHKRAIAKITLLLYVCCVWRI